MILDRALSLTRRDRWAPPDEPECALAYACASAGAVEGSTGLTRNVPAQRRAGTLRGVNCSARVGTAQDGQGLMRLKVPPKAWTPAPLPVVPVWTGPELVTKGCSWL
jgi:hypothetical protein